MKFTPPKYRHQAERLLKQFQLRGNELTWNSDGIIFIDQVAIPQSDIFIFFPYLFKHKHPNTLIGFQDFVEKIRQMQLQHLIVYKSRQIRLESTKTTNSGKNWWFLG